MTKQLRTRTTTMATAGKRARWMAWAAALVLSASTVHAATDPADKCEGAQNSLVGGYFQCLSKAQAKLIAGGAGDGPGAADTKCQVKYEDKWTKAETKAAGACPSDGFMASMLGTDYDCVNAAQAELAGGPVPLTFDECIAAKDSCVADSLGCQSDLLACQTVTCGDDIAGDGEACDGADLNGESCATQAPATPAGTLACAPGCGGFDTTGCLARYDDSGPTVIDRVTGLEWEKKSSIDGTQNLSDPHDGDNRYTWTTGAPGYPPNGTAYVDFLGRLNGADGSACYAGHCDWRLPSLEELQTTAIPYYCGTYPTPCVVDPVFLPVRNDDYYWTGSTYSGANIAALYLNFFQGADSFTNKLLGLYVRAVRSR